MTPFIAALQWADSTFPSGRYTLSNGLEGLIQASWVEESEPRTLISSLLTQVYARTDLIAHFRVYDLLAAQHLSMQSLREINALLSAVKTTTATRRSSIRVGKQLALMAQELGITIPTIPQPHAAISAACIYHAQGVSVEDSADAELYAFVSQTASCAVRLGHSDHIEAQRIIAYCTSLFPSLKDLARAAPIEEMGSYAPIAELTSACHEYAPARLFMD